MTVVNRGGALERDDGVCRNSFQMSSSAERALAGRNVQAERGRDPGRRRPAARSREDAPRGATALAAIVYKPARTGDRVGYVVGQFPRKGTASAYDKITLILAKSLHGVIPRVVGLTLAAAERMWRSCTSSPIVGGIERPRDRPVVARSDGAPAPGIR